DDASILGGGFFKDHPQLILGKEVGAPGDDDDQTAKPRWGYEVQGEFTHLPPIVRRPWCDACDISHLRAQQELDEALPPEAELEEAPPAQAAVEGPLRRAHDLGLRVGAYLSAVAAGEDRRAVWPELHEDLVAWGNANGNPWLHLELRATINTESTLPGRRGLPAFLHAFEQSHAKGGRLIPGLRRAPTFEPPVPVAAREDVVALADWIYRAKGRCTFYDLAAAQMREGREAIVRLREDVADLFIPPDAQAWVREQLPTLLRAGWFVDCDEGGDDWKLVVPSRDYLSGALWPKYDRARQPLGRNAWGEALTEDQLNQQQAALLKAISPVTYDELEHVSPLLGWVPVSILSDFVTGMVPDWERERHPAGWRIELERRDGFVLPRGYTFQNYAEHGELPAAGLEFLGFVNGDLETFKVKKQRGEEESAAERRKRRVEQITQQFHQFIGADPTRKVAIAEAYNRFNRGFVLPAFDDEPLHIARWTDAEGAPRLKPHQVRGARRVLANRGGLLAFGVGVGKTYTGLGILARARQEGWGRRPVVVVPNSIVWKWYKDFQRVLPDFRVAVVGSKPARVEAPFAAGAVRPGAGAVAWAAQNKRSRRKVELLGRLPEGAWTPVDELAAGDVAVVGHLRELVASGVIQHKPARARTGADTDSPEERAEKWRRFQAGEYDAVLLTYSMLGRTRMDDEAVRIYADRQQSIKRQIEQDKRNATKVQNRVLKAEADDDTDEDGDESEEDGGKKPKGLTERQAAILEEGTAAWIAEKMELPEGQAYDPGLTWDEIGVDLLIIDEAQNFKNLYTPERRDGGIPKFMGGGGEGSNRAWQLDFRCASVRRRAGGRGVVLLSATPAKNSPLEFYNLLQYLDEGLWPNRGVYTAEQFIENYLRIENQLIITDKMKAEERPAVTGFRNLDDLRDVVFRYGDFKSAEDVGLKLPEVTATPVWVELDAQQNTLYAEIVARIEELLDQSKQRSAEGKKAAGEILGLLQRLAMITLHPGLMGTYDWKGVRKANIEPYSPKIAAMVSNVLKQRTCGHIVFAEPIASHWWMKEALVQAGIPEGRIAILNASTAKDTAVRQEVAERFNGDPLRGVEPDFDVVIANSIAYEGIDLQTRTCAIHHMDLPWEPATIEQRNGRGVRQGNTLSNIAINFYLAKNSMDGARYALIQGKHGWMKDLLDSQIKETSNPL
ncbi:MAG: hypothetical protein JNM72_21540, partial [Deltaproteobacteria bacterium]|nr:hypothetical protein [Deltaproteobacteria bacterium]